MTTTLCPEELDNMDSYVDTYIDNLKVGIVFKIIQIWKI